MRRRRTPRLAGEVPLSGLEGIRKSGGRVRAAVSKARGESAARQLPIQQAAVTRGCKRRATADANGADAEGKRLRAAPRRSKRSAASGEVEAKASKARKRGSMA